MSTATSESLPYTESWLEGHLSTRFYTRTYRPSHKSPKAVLVFIHGFAEHVGRYDHIHPQLPKQDIAVFTFDQRGYGKTVSDEKERSKGSSWGKTCWDDQMEDVNWALRHANKEFPGVPLFLMGHSMGGGEVLGWASGYGDKNLIASLSGVIASSPLIQQTKPASKFLRWIGGKASILSPYTLIPADLNPDHLSRNKAANEAYMKDPLIKQTGSLRGIGDMLSKGEELIKDQRHKHWPLNLPVLFVHGTADQITSHHASQKFHDALSVKNKKILLVDGGYHELVNEPGQVPDQVVNEIVAFIDSNLPPPAEEGQIAPKL
ncbi:alpha/beta-hydrolase [Marasmius fiardii PR-910]|nr:alpha/beta-hydrolase [Marasmius fiardii PR-910]